MGERVFIHSFAVLYDYWKTHEKKNTALLVIDVINSCCNPQCEKNEWKISFTKIRKMVPKLVQFIQQYKKQFGGMVIYTTCTPWTKNHLPSNINEIYSDPAYNYYSSDKSGFSEEFYKVKPGKDPVVVKNSYDAFTSPKLISLLKKKNIRYLVVTGVFSDGCVHATIQGGFSKGYNIVMLKDLTETTDVPIRQKLQTLLKTYTWPTMFGPTLTSREFLNIIS